MNFSRYSLKSPSIRCSSSTLPSVQLTSAWVSPLVNSAEPCVRGKSPMRHSMGRTASSRRPSQRTPLTMSSRKPCSSSVAIACDSSTACAVAASPARSGRAKAAFTAFFHSESLSRRWNLMGVWMRARRSA